MIFGSSADKIISNPKSPISTHIIRAAWKNNGFGCLDLTFLFRDEVYTCEKVPAGTIGENQISEDIIFSGSV